jgi:biotin/methionine sulfoxide reductase
VPAQAIRELARRMAASRTLISVTWSLQRADHGEQVPWMAVTLAAMLGQLGLPGGGVAHGYGSTAGIGAEPLPYGLPALPPVKNPVRSFIPVARISDLLLRPGEEFDFNGQRLTYPDIHLVYWCGGNPFHHHQHLSRLRRALGRPDTIVVHDAYWTSMARHADIVLPATVTLERNDLGASNNDGWLTAMRQAIEPYGQARSDFAIFGALAAELGAEQGFTEGRSEMQWLEHLYETWRANAGQRGFAFPTFAEFWAAGRLPLPRGPKPSFGFEAFRRDPDGSSLPTPSGRIEIFSETIASFGYADCPGHPTWLEPAEWLGGPLARRFPLHLIADNPATRLHSQLDVGAFSQSSKIQGREPIRMHPSDAGPRGIADGDIVRVFNDRGSCLAGAVVTDAIRQGVVQLSTGAWYDPLDPSDVDALCVHGNPNVLTRDVGTSRLAQGCAGQHALVEIERWNGPPPPIKVLDAPRIERRT